MFAIESESRSNNAHEPPHLHPDLPHINGPPIPVRTRNVTANATYRQMSTGKASGTRRSGNSPGIYAGANAPRRAVTRRERPGLILLRGKARLSSASASSMPLPMLNLVAAVGGKN